MGKVAWRGGNNNDIKLISNKYELTKIVTNSSYVQRQSPI